MDLTPELIFSLIQSSEQYSVDFDDAWQWIGWAKKQHAKDVLINNFVEGVDFLRKGVKSPSGGRPSEWIMLTVDCFKSLAMMAGTSRGREVRLYFIRCEAELKRRIEEERQRAKASTQQRLVGAMVSEKVLSRKPKFDEEFYELLYQKRGQGWESRDPSSRPPCVANWTNQTVYDRLLGGKEPGGVKDKLNQVNPVQENGRRKDRHHWHFKPLGEYHLSSHLAAVKAVARLSPDGDWDRFMYNISKALPNGEALQLSLLNELESLDVTCSNPPWEPKK